MVYILFLLPSPIKFMHIIQILLNTNDLKSFSFINRVHCLQTSIKEQLVLEPFIKLLGIQSLYEVLRYFPK